MGKNCFRRAVIVVNKANLTESIEDICKKHKQIQQCIYSLHGEDAICPHYHIYLDFGIGAHNVSEVAEWFNTPENFIREVKENVVDMLSYLFHSPYDMDLDDIIDKYGSIQGGGLD